MSTAYAFKPTYAISPELPRAPAPALVQPAPQTPAQRLLDQLSPDTQLTGLSIAVLRIARLLETGDSDLSALTDALLAEPFIAQKLIRSANALTVRRGSGVVTTISRALVVLGLNEVRSIATSTALLDHLEDRQQAGRIQEEFAQSLYATTLARELAGHGCGVDAEEAQVCTLFRSFGRLMAAMYLYRPYEEALALARSEELREGEAAARTLGMGFDRLGIEILNRWHLPERITQAALPCPRSLRATANPLVRLRTLAEFCVEVSESVRVPSLLSRRHAIELLLERYGEGLGLHRRVLKEALRATDERAQQIGNSLGIFGTGAAGDSLEDGNFMALSAGSRNGVSMTLSAGVASLGRMLERQQSPDAIVTHGVEVLRRAFEFQRVFVCEAERGTGNCRIARLAGKALPLEDSLSFIARPGSDLFTAALLKSADVYIAEAADERIQRALPTWHRAICPDARSFLLLPLSSREGYSAFLYADHARSNPRRPTRDEVQLLKTLKTQVALALRQAALAH